MSSLDEKYPIKYELYRNEKVESFQKLIEEKTEREKMSEKSDENKVVSWESPISYWFELTYAQFLTVPRLVMESMPIEWQEKMVALLEEMDETFDWRPQEGRYWVKLKDDKGRYCDAPLSDYRHGSCEHLRIKHEDTE